MNSKMENNVNNISQNLINKVRMPEIVYDQRYSKDCHIARYKRSRIILIAMLLLIFFSISVFAFNSEFIFIPGYGSLYKDSDNITHSIITTATITKDGYTHKIISAYIKNNRIHVKIILFNSYTMKYIQANLDNSPTDYWLYYKGIKCDKYTRLYGSDINLSFRIPNFDNAETMQFDLFSGHDFIGKISLTSAANLEKESMYLPNDTNSGLMITVNIERKDNKLILFISPVLPPDADRDAIPMDMGYGYTEGSVVIMNKNKNIYKSTSDNEYDRTASILRLNHIYEFFLPEYENNFTIVINDIYYFTKESHRLREIKGEWYIDIT